MKKITRMQLPDQISVEKRITQANNTPLDGKLLDKVARLRKVKFMRHRESDLHITRVGSWSRLRKEG
jgi:hypothetical protein